MQMCFRMRLNFPTEGEGMKNITEWERGICFFPGFFWGRDARTFTCRYSWLITQTQEENTFLALPGKWSSSNPEANA